MLKKSTTVHLQNYNVNPIPNTSRKETPLPHTTGHHIPPPPQT